ncbi:MAG: hypothetical protein V4671_04675, partial [Armatimonadota bacterium]
MATTLAAMAIDLLGNDAPFNATMDRAVNRAGAQGNRAGASFGSSFATGFSSPILNAISGINSAIGGIQTIGSLVLDVSGMRTNAVFGNYRRQLVGIAGDVGIASRAFKGLQNIAGNSNFDTDAVVSLGLKYAGKDGDVMGAVGKTQNVIDAAAALGVENGFFNNFQKNLTDMGVKGSSKIDKVDREQLTTYAPQVGLQIGRILGVSAAEANRRLLTMSGKEVVSLIERIGAANAGFAARQAGNDPIGIGKNILESIKNGMEPTGGVMNAILTPVARNVKTLVDHLGAFNTATGGGAGLIGIIGGGVLTVRYFGGATAFALGGVRTLTGSLLEMGNAAAAAALLARGGAGGAGAAGAVAGGVGAAKGAGAAGAVAGGVGAAKGVGAA